MSKRSRAKGIKDNPPIININNSSNMKFPFRSFSSLIFSPMTEITHRVYKYFELGN